MYEKKYRLNVAGIILHQDYPEVKKIWVGLRNDMKDVWQFPQGGVDYGENIQDAFFREMNEELGTSNLEIVAQFPKWLYYDFPRFAKGRYLGQKQRYFLAKLKDNADIDIQTQKPEFEEYRFVDLDEVLEVVSDFKVPIYTKALDYFISKGFL